LYRSEIVSSPHPIRGDHERRSGRATIIAALITGVMSAVG